MKVLPIVATGIGEANDASMILSASIGNNHVVFTGDSTATTFFWANYFISKSPDSISYFKNNKFLFVSCPHHGSYTTATRKDHEMAAIDKFGEYIQAQSCVSSSRYHKGWKHSNIYVIEEICRDQYKIDNHTLFLSEDTPETVERIFDISSFTNQTRYRPDKTKPKGEKTMLSYFYHIDKYSSAKVYFIPPNDDKMYDDFNLVNATRCTQTEINRRRIKAKCYT
jgi:hypothetical protein